MNDIIVSIFILTHNQEQFIAQTIESILIQKAKFNYQLVIGEDCSTDATRIICEQYANQYSQKIKLLPALKSNIGLIANYMRTIKECDGKYIAICDGDDYWIDECKLQKQVGFLDNNPDFSIVYTGVKRLFLNGDCIEKDNLETKSITNFEDLILDNHIPSVTALFKNRQNQDNELPKWILNFPYGDWPTYLWTIKNGGKIHFLKDVTAVYRTEVGVSAQIRKINSDLVKVNLAILEAMVIDGSFSQKKESVLASIKTKKLELITSLNREKKYCKAFRQYLNSIGRNGDRYEITKLYLYSIYQLFTKPNRV
jgi:glycosyltransferase involved in cell wall biosynthesis